MKIKFIFLILILCLSQSSFAVGIDPDKISRLVVLESYSKLRKAYQAYKEEVSEALDNIAIKAGKDKKSPEEKEVYFRKFWNRPDSAGLTPLHWAVLWPFKESAGIIEFLIEKGSDPNLNFPESTEERTSRLGQIAPFEHIIPMQVPVMIESLSMSCKVLSQASILGILISQGKTANVLNILEKKDVTAINTPYPMYVDTGKMIERLSIEAKQTQALPLVEAVMTRQWRVVEALITRGANVNTASPHTGGTPLHALILKGLIPNRIKIRSLQVTGLMNQPSKARDFLYEKKDSPENQCKFVRLLIQHGADPRLKDSDQNDVITAATLKGDESLAQMILEIAAKHSPNAEISAWATESLHRQIQKQLQAEKELFDWISANEPSSLPGNMRQGKAKKLRKSYLDVEEQPQFEETVEEKSNSEQIESDSEPLEKSLELGKKAPKKQKQPRLIDSSEGDNWQVVQSRRSERKSFEHDISRFPTQITIGEKSIPVMLSDTYHAHIAQRHEEVGGHDLLDEAVFEILQNPCAILKNQAQKEQLRYVFFGTTPDGQFARVILSKWPRERHFSVITSYRSERLPRNFAEIDVEDSPLHRQSTAF